MKKLILAVGMILCALAACTTPQDAGSTAANCGDGVAVSSACVYEAGLIIEGFNCPAEMLTRTDFQDFALCSDGPPTDGLLNDLAEEGFEPDPMTTPSTGECTRPGAQVPAPDGCNTCTCDEGGWSCTEIACEVDCRSMDFETRSCSAIAECVIASCQADAECDQFYCVETPQDGASCDITETFVPLGRCGTCVCGDDNTWACEEWCESPTPAPACEDHMTSGACADAGCTEAQCGDEGPCPDRALCTDLPEHGNVCAYEGAHVDRGCGPCDCIRGTWECGPRCQ